ncbi:hypothetical protein [Haloarcula onubensis]|uniref:Uncharacterized protein n=1 Tax=Haloarcula onubensis TaxID=2950539 RepID=A0ABU2FV96_9EURY|nr:hypothetical protein [Halomicroarcula sp. S3CR25-11]MDS0284699.1 hypothetical protein [Halomicroarcula sp. S3CR25-11]
MKRGNSAEKSAVGRWSAPDRASDQRSMSTDARTGQKTSGTNREFQFRDQHDEPAIIPDTWAQQAVHESGDGERFYAVEVRVGLRLEFTVDHTGQPIEGPHTDEPGIQTLYVSADGGRAVVIESTAVRSDADGVVPREDWASVLVEPAAEVGTVKAERRDAYRALVRELYEVDN